MEKSGTGRRTRNSTLAEKRNELKIEPIESNEENNRPASSNLRKRKNVFTEIKIESSEDDELIEIVEKSAAKTKKLPLKSANSKAGAKKIKKQEIKQEDNDDDDAHVDDDKASAVKNEPKSSAKENIKTIKFTGDIPLDETFIEMHGQNYTIYREGHVIYDAMLNQTNLQYNNNKYYLIQLVEKNNSKNYSVWLRWGRVGKIGQNTWHQFGTNLDEAKNFFCKKFYDKTKNEWSSKDSFVKVHGKYDLVEKDYSSNDSNLKKEPSDNADSPKVEIPASNLDKNLQNLIELICNVSEMENLLKEMKFDAEKAPLGKLSKNQIKAGYAALKEIEDHILNKTFGSSFTQANNNFYTRIPHNFGMKTPPLIRTHQQLREKMKLLEVLDEIEVAVKALNQESNIVNPIDRHYEQLECSLMPVDRNSEIFKIIEKYLTLNHAPTHADYKLKLLEVYEAEKKGEKEKFKDCGNRMLLWHGSRLTNWAGILSQGLRIAPPEAPVTGYMFGKGCYFSDCSSKSANYCYTNSVKNTGLLSLSEVSLGVCNELKNADNNADKLPKGKMSTKGLGKSEPDQKDWVKLENGCVVPIGKLKSVADPKDANSYSLLYNEYIVYDVTQIKLKYLVKIKFEYEDDEDED